MPRRVEGVILIVLMVAIAFGIFVFLTKDTARKTYGDKSQQDLLGKDGATANGGGKNSGDKNKRLASGAGGSFNLDPDNLNQDVSNPLNLRPFEGNDCGVSKEISFNDKQLNFSTDLDEAQKIALDCIASYLPACAQAKITFVSESGDLLYYGIWKKGDFCIVSYSDSNNARSCSFSQNAINSLIQKALEKNPSDEAAKSYEVLSFVNSGGGEVLLLDGTRENVVCG